MCRARGEDKHFVVISDLSQTSILLFAMKDSRCDVWARAHAMWGGWAKRPVATSRVT
eukprot:COSAG02_NODE_49441_length_326_cov_25.022026_1_plen_56_part_10